MVAPARCHAGAEQGTGSPSLAGWQRKHQRVPAVVRGARCPSRCSPPPSLGDVQPHLLPMTFSPGGKEQVPKAAVQGAQTPASQHDRTSCAATVAPSRRTHGDTAGQRLSPVSGAGVLAWSEHVGPLLEGLGQRRWGAARVGGCSARHGSASVDVPCPSHGVPMSSSPWAGSNNHPI